MNETTTGLVLVDEPLPGVVRIALSRPEKRNAMSNLLRGELFDALERADRDPEIRVMILRGAGPSFCSGYDLAQDFTAHQPFHTAGGIGNWPRHVTKGCFRIWDLAKPVIAKSMASALPGALNSQLHAIWSTSPKMRRSGTPPSARSARPTTSSIRG